MITICLTYFKSLTLDNLRAALCSVRWQDLRRVAEVIVVDNDTDDSVEDIKAVVEDLCFFIPVRVLSYKHGDAMKTHPWSTNLAVMAASTPWIFFTRADYILDPTILMKSFALGASADFIVAKGYHLDLDVLMCSAKSAWPSAGVGALHRLPGSVIDYTLIDSGVWMIRRPAFAKVGGLNESLTAWGHAQTEFQHRLHQAQFRFALIPEVLFYHPLHAAPRDIEAAHSQLRDLGMDLKAMWERHDGVQPYR